MKTYRNVHELVGDLATVSLLEVGDDGLEGGFLLGLGTALRLVDMEDSIQVVRLRVVSEGITLGIQSKDLSGSAESNRE
jgi:hypothetical protein